MHYFVASIIVLGAVIILAYRVTVDGIVPVAMVALAVSMFYSAVFVLRQRKTRPTDEE